MAWQVWQLVWYFRANAGTACAVEAVTSSAAAATTGMAARRINTKTDKEVTSVPPSPGRERRAGVMYAVPWGNGHARRSCFGFQAILERGANLYGFPWGLCDAPVEKSRAAPVRDAYDLLTNGSPWGRAGTRQGMKVKRASPLMVLAQPSSEAPCGFDRARMRT